MYIQYTMDQLYLPMDLEEDIPENHLVRVVNAAVNRIDDEIFAAVYKGGGGDSYHPKMLTKVIIYAMLSALFPPGCYTIKFIQRFKAKLKERVRLSIGTR